MKNWKTNLGGAISITGTSLIGIGLVPQVASGPSKLLMIIAIVGFILSALGKGVTALFAADASTVNTIATAVDKINRQGPAADADPVAKTAPLPSPPPGGTVAVLLLLGLLACGGCAAYHSLIGHPLAKVWQMHEANEASEKWQAEYQRTNNVP